VVDARNAIAKNGATVASYYLENVIGVLEFFSVSESHTIT